MHLGLGFGSYNRERVLYRSYKGHTGPLPAAVENSVRVDHSKCLGQLCLVGSEAFRSLYSCCIVH